MALTFTKIDEDVWGKTTVKVYNILLDSSYPTNGYKASLGFAARAFGLSKILGMQLIGLNAAASVVVHLAFDYTNTALMAFRANLPAHSHPLTLKNAAVADGATTRVNAGTNLLGANTGGDLTIAGAGANGGVQNSTAVQVPLVEVSNAVDLSAVTARFLIFGRNI
jgi:hypothetical protein